VVTCVPGKPKGGKVKVTCSVKLASAAAARAVFKHGRRTVAKGFTARLPRGRYRLVVRYGAKTVVHRVRL
jgi:hypothetical protein